jgi:hypothetical protein
VRVGGPHPPPFRISIVMYKVVVDAPAERADTLPLFLHYPYMFSVSTTLFQPERGMGGGGARYDNVNIEKLKH